MSYNSTNLTSFVCHINCTDSKAGADTDGHLEMWPYLIYIIEGIFMAIANLLIVVTIVKDPKLRLKKEYMMVAALGSADLCNELAFIAAGVYRVPLILHGNPVRCRTSWYCMMTVHALIWTYSIPLTYFMLLAVSIDRMFCVVKPLSYHSRGLKYSLALSSLFYFLAIPVAVTSVALSKKASLQDHCGEYESICLIDHAIGNDYIFYMTTIIQVMCSSASVLLYACIPFLYRRKIRKLSEAHHYQQLLFLKAQKKLLVTLGISSICTFFLMVVPSVARAVTYNSTYEAFPWAGILMNTNPCVNTFLFVVRHKRFRKSFLSLFPCISSQTDLDETLTTDNIGDRREYSF